MFKRLLLVFVFLFTAATAIAETREIYSPGDGYLNLRTGPSTKYSIIERMYNGQRVQILKRSGGWAKVQLANGTLGWAFYKYLVRPSTHSNYPTKQVYAPYDEYLNLRTGPGTGYAIIQRMYNGWRVRVLERRGHWLRVRMTNGTEGWAYDKYLVD